MYITEIPPILDEDYLTYSVRDYLLDNILRYESGLIAKDWKTTNTITIYSTCFYGPDEPAYENNIKYIEYNVQIIKEKLQNSELKDYFDIEVINPMFAKYTGINKYGEINIKLKKEYKNKVKEVIVLLKMKNLISLDWEKEYV